MVAIAMPPNATAMVNSRGAGSAISERKIPVTDGRAVAWLGAVGGKTIAATRKAAPVMHARTRTAGLQPSCDSSQSAPGKKIADASAPQIVSTAIARSGSTGFRRTAVVIVT